MESPLSPRVLDILEWPLISEELCNRCSSSLGKERAQNLTPLSGEESQAQMDKISALKEIMLLGDGISFPGISDIRELLPRAAKGSILSLEELFQVRQFVIGSCTVRSFLKEQTSSYPPLEEEYEALHEL